VKCYNLVDGIINVEGNFCQISFRIEAKDRVRIGKQILVCHQMRNGKFARRPHKFELDIITFSSCKYSSQDGPILNWSCVSDRPVDGAFWDFDAMNITGAAASIRKITWPDATILQRFGLARLPVERHDLKWYKGVHKEDGAGALWHQRHPVLLVVALVKVLVIDLDDALNTSLLVDRHEGLPPGCM